MWTFPRLCSLPAQSCPAARHCAPHADKRSVVVLLRFPLDSDSRARGCAGGRSLISFPQGRDPRFVPLLHQRHPRLRHRSYRPSETSPRRARSAEAAGNLTVPAPPAIDLHDSVHAARKYRGSVVCDRSPGNPWRFQCSSAEPVRDSRQKLSAAFCGPGPRRGFRPACRVRRVLPDPRSPVPAGPFPLLLLPRSARVPPILQEIPCCAQPRKCVLSRTRFHFRVRLCFDVHASRSLQRVTHVPMPKYCAAFSCVGIAGDHQCLACNHCEKSVGDRGGKFFTRQLYAPGFHAATYFEFLPLEPIHSRSLRLRVVTETGKPMNRRVLAQPS